MTVEGVVSSSSSNKDKNNKENPVLELLLLDIESMGKVRKVCQLSVMSSSLACTVCQAISVGAKQLLGRDPKTSGLECERVALKISEPTINNLYFVLTRH